MVMQSIIQMNGPALLKSKEASQMLRLPLSTLYRLTKNGNIAGFKVGKQWRYKKEDILRYFNTGINFDNIKGFSQDFRNKIKEANDNVF